MAGVHELAFFWLALHESNFTFHRRMKSNRKTVSPKTHELTKFTRKKQNKPPFV